MQWGLTSFESFGFFASSTSRHCLVHLEHHTVPDKMERAITNFKMLIAFAGAHQFGNYSNCRQFEIVCLDFLKLKYLTFKAIASLSAGAMAL